MVSQNFQIERPNTSIDLEEYGVDHDSPLPQEELNTIEVPETLSSLSTERRTSYVSQSTRCYSDLVT